MLRNTCCIINVPLFIECSMRINNLLCYNNCVHFSKSLSKPNSLHCWTKLCPAFNIKGSIFDYFYMRQHFLVHDSHIQCIVIGQEMINYDKKILQEHFFSPAFVTYDSVFDRDTDDAEVQVLFLPLVTCQSYFSPHVPNRFHEKSVELLVKRHSMLYLIRAFKEFQIFWR